MSGLRLTVNGVDHLVSAPAGARLVTVLRENLGLTGTKEACGTGACGACMVLLGGRPVMSCITLAITVDQPVETVEHVACSRPSLAVAFAEHGGFQCGFCTPGQIVSAYAAIRDGVDPADAAGIRRAMSSNICRCTGYAGILRAVTDDAAPSDPCAHVPSLSTTEPHQKGSR